MNVLLFGEYNRSHKFTKQGLQALGHNAIVVGLTDGFKKVEVDVSLEVKFFNYKIPLFFRKVILKLFKFDLSDIEIFFNFFKNKHKLQNYDVVQLINEFPLEIHPFLEKKCLSFLFKHNKKTFLLACSDDCIYVDYLLNSTLKYHLLTPYLENKNLKKFYSYSLMYTKKSRLKLHDFIFKNIEMVSPADFDYVMAYKDHEKTTQLIPHPVNISNFDYIEPVIGEKIIIFHGINRFNYYRKGNFHFEAAIKIIKDKFPDKIEIISLENTPYKTYVKSFEKAHILLDQTYSYDQGYNALEAMAKGKVVFTGAEKEWMSHYKVEEDTVAINALPDANKIAEKLEWLILNPEKIVHISKKARHFVEKEHDHIKCAKALATIWERFI